MEIVRKILVESIQDYEKGGKFYYDLRFSKNSLERKAKKKSTKPESSQQLKSEKPSVRAWSAALKPTSEKNKDRVWSAALKPLDE